MPMFIFEAAPSVIRKHKTRNRTVATQNSCVLCVVKATKENKKRPGTENFNCLFFSLVS